MDRRDRAERTIAVAVDKEKSSRDALKWALDNLISKDQTVKIVHVKDRSLPSSSRRLPPSGRNDDPSSEQGSEHDEICRLMLPFRCFCRRRRVQCETFVLEDTDVARALIDFASQNRVEALLLSAPAKTGLSRLFKSSDVPAHVMKWAPDFCTVYLISKGRVSSIRNATRPLPAAPAASGMRISHSAEPLGAGELFDELSTQDNDTEGDCGWLSTDSNFISFYENLESGLGEEPNVYLGEETPPRYSNVESEDNVGLSFFPDFKPPAEVSPTKDFDRPDDNCRVSWTPQQNTEARDDELIRRLNVELKHTTDMYHASCKEALAAKEQAWELEQWKLREEKRVEDAMLSEQKALAMVEVERGKCKAATEEAEATRKLLEMEIRLRVELELRVQREAGERKKCFEALDQSHMALKYQSLYHMVIVVLVLLFYFYSSVFM